MNKNLWAYLITRKNKDLDTSDFYAAKKKGGIDMYNTPTLEAVSVLKQLQVDLKAHFCDHQKKTR